MSPIDSFSVLHSLPIQFCYNHVENITFAFMYLIDPNAGQTIRLFKEKRILAGLANLPTRLQMTRD